MTINDNVKVGMFKTLANKSLYEVGVEFGLDKKYKNEASVKNAVYRYYSEVKNNPEKFLISKDLYDLVIGTVSGRKIISDTTQQSLREKNESLEKMDFSQLVSNTRTKSLRLLRNKLESINTKKNKHIVKQ